MIECTGCAETSASALSRELRTGDDPHLRNRRAIVGCSLGASACMGVVLAYQMGLIGRMPEPDLPYLDADEVDASEEAYEMVRTPDGALGLLSYAATAVLASMDGADRVERRRWIPLALAAATGSTGSRRRRRARSAGSSRSPTIRRPGRSTRECSRISLAASR